MIWNLGLLTCLKEREALQYIVEELFESMLTNTFLQTCLFDDVAFSVMLT